MMTEILHLTSLWCCDGEKPSIMQPQEKLQPTSVITLALNARVTRAVNKWKFTPHLLRNKKKNMTRVYTIKNADEIFILPEVCCQCSRELLICPASVLTINTYHTSAFKQTRKEGRRHAGKKTPIQTDVLESFDPDSF